jgi:GNAT superfamily N-acetyltransferase
MCAGPHGKGVTTEVRMLAAHTAGDQALVDQLVDLVNQAYEIGEAGLWLNDATRTGATEIDEAIRSGGMLAATAGGQLVGCVYLRRLDPTTAAFGLLSVAPDHWGHGVGRELVNEAEHLMQSHGVTTMQLELLVPKGWVHPEKAKSSLVHPDWVQGRQVGTVRARCAAPRVSAPYGLPVSYLPETLVIAFVPSDRVGRPQQRDCRRACDMSGCRVA